MQTKVPATEKKRFLKWLISFYTIKPTEVRDILSYISGESLILENLHFIDEGIEHCPSGLFFSISKGKKSFKFYHEGNTYSDIIAVYNYIRNNKAEDLYITLEIPEKEAKHINILEENPFLPRELSLEHRYNDDANNVLSKATFEFRKAKLMEKIDNALINNKKREFRTLAKEYKDFVELYNEHFKL